MHMISTAVNRPFTTHYMRYCGALSLLMTSHYTHAQDIDLYTRLGGEQTLQIVVHKLVERVHTDTKTQRSFKDSNLARIESKLYEQLCVLAHGPCQYTGDEMKLVHGGLHITHAEFYSMVQMLREELDSAGVGNREKNELLALLAPMQDDVVTAP